MRNERSVFRVATTAATLVAVVGTAGLQAQSAGAVRGDGGGSQAAAPAPPTFYADVLPILQSNCQSCHQPVGMNYGGMVAPMSFTSYEETRPWAAVIAEVVKQRRMPPWHASRQHQGTFKGERYLTDVEIATLVAWAEAGAAAGNPAEAPAAAAVRTLGEGEWWIGEPDLVLSFEQPFCMDDDVHDLYVDLPMTLTEEMVPQDQWIKAVEYRPGSAVHHILGGVGGLAPGHGPQIYEEGYGRMLPKVEGEREITFNMHYNKTPGPGTALCDDTRVGIVFYEPGEVIRYITRGEELSIRDFVIPAGAPSYSASHEHVFDRDVYIMRFNPHMHLRGKAALFEITYPDGEHEVLLHVPKYDFNWQHHYAFKEQVFAPQGSKVRMTLWWDNSAENPSNPDPAATVRWGLPTYAEMGYGFMQYREIEERHIVVGETVSDTARENLAEPESQHPSGTNP